MNRRFFMTLLSGLAVPAGLLESARRWAVGGYAAPVTPMLVGEECIGEALPVIHGSVPAETVIGTVVCRIEKVFINEILVWNKSDGKKLEPLKVKSGDLIDVSFS